MSDDKYFVVRRVLHTEAVEADMLKDLFSIVKKYEDYDIPRHTVSTMLRTLASKYLI